MTGLVHIAPGLALALGLGLASGWWSGVPARPGRVGAALLVVAAAFGLASSETWPPGRAGLWLDSGLAHLLAYLGGCLAGTGAAALIMRQRSKKTSGSATR